MDWCSRLTKAFANFEAAAARAGADEKQVIELQQALWKTDSNSSPTCESRRWRSEAGCRKPSNVIRVPVTDEAPTVIWVSQPMLVGQVAGDVRRKASWLP